MRNMILLFAGLMLVVKVLRTEEGAIGEKIAYVWRGLTGRSVWHSRARISRHDGAYIATRLMLVA